MDPIWIEILPMTAASSLLHLLSCLRFLIVEKGCSVVKMFKELNSLWRIWENTNGDIILFKFQQCCDRNLSLREYKGQGTYYTKLEFISAFTFPETVVSE